MGDFEQPLPESRYRTTIAIPAQAGIQSAIRIPQKDLLTIVIPATAGIQSKEGQVRMLTGFLLSQSLPPAKAGE